MSRRQSPVADERGAVLLTVFLTMITILAIAALVLDLAAVRLNRSVSQTLADSAATAGAIETAGQNGRDGCATAFDYLNLNIEGAPFTGQNCLTIPSTCDAGTASVSTQGTSGPWTATVTFPVPDASPLMQPSTISSPTQSIHADDGPQCERFAVSVTRSRDHVFARIIGADSQTTQIHAVARSLEQAGKDFALNLLVLERYDCNVVSASGGGASNGGILVDAVLNPDTGQLDPGFLAVDSDATGSCGGNGVIDVNGSNGFVRADGRDGCPGQVGSHTGAGGLTVGEGCGQIQLIAPGVPGCNYPACTSGGTVAPDPTPRDERITRAPIDHRYNCKASYPFPAAWSIDPCPDPPDPHIDDLVTLYGGPGVPGGFSTWTGAGYPCNPSTPTVVPPGDWYIDCSNFRVRDFVIFTGGDIVFEGDITINTSAALITNASNVGVYPFTPATDASVMYLRDGRISKAGQGSLVWHKTLVYLSSTSDIKMTGGSGDVIWSAPTSGDFEDLALWAESTGTNDFAGSAGLDLEGVFFAPWATIGYQGSGSQVQVAAQFISRRLEVGGNGVLVVRPNFDRAVLFPREPESQLIR